MALPSDVMSIDNERRFVSKVARLIDQHAESKTGRRFDPDSWIHALAPRDFALTMLCHFIGTWENSGSFVNEAREWWDQSSRLKKALKLLGCAKAAALLADAAELGMQIANRYDADQDITPEQRDERARINREADNDVSFAKIV